MEVMRTAIGNSRPSLQAAVYACLQPASSDRITLLLAACALYFVLLAVPLAPQLLLLLLLAHVGTTWLLHFWHRGRLEAQGELVAATRGREQLYQAQLSAAAEAADGVTAVRLELSRLQREVAELPGLTAQVEAQQAELDRRRALLACRERQAGQLTTLGVKLGGLRRRLRARDRLTWAVQLLRDETTKLPALRAEYDHLKGERAAQQALRAEVAALQQEHDDAAALEARRPLLEERAARVRELRWDMVELQAESESLPSVQAAHARLLAAVQAQRSAATAAASVAAEGHHPSCQLAGTGALLPPSRRIPLSDANGQQHAATTNAAAPGRYSGDQVNEAVLAAALSALKTAGIDVSVPKASVLANAVGDDEAEEEAFSTPHPGAFTPTLLPKSGSHPGGGRAAGAADMPTPKMLPYEADLTIPSGLVV